MIACTRVDSPVSAICNKLGFDGILDRRLKFLIKAGHQNRRYLLVLLFERCGETGRVKIGRVPMGFKEEKEN